VWKKVWETYEICLPSDFSNRANELCDVSLLRCVVIGSSRK